ncbi:cyclodeaminase/cyclohydrolase family protein [Stutzerimonas zhaodongensis]|uniref:cyclodeaminase/cyclohydrolase family protein n=1 Tax=Stutzerimonas zhaodongensis TaxID=1176257 RepID=UPI0039F02468
MIASKLAPTKSRLHAPSASDAQAGAVLIHSGLSAALINVDADMGSLDDPTAREQAAQTRRRLQDEGDGLLKRPRDRIIGEVPGSA